MEFVVVDIIDRELYHQIYWFLVLKESRVISYFQDVCRNKMTTVMGCTNNFGSRCVCSSITSVFILRPVYDV
jgi:hypothetical protein